MAHLDGTVEAHVVTFAGFAGAAPAGKPSLERIHMELERYILDNALTDAVVVGHSLGGHMALWLGETVPGLGAVVDVEGLPFLAAAGDGTMTESRATAIVRPRVEKFRAMTTEQFGAWVWENMSGMFTDLQSRDLVLGESVRSDIDTVAQALRRRGHQGPSWRPDQDRRPRHGRRGLRVHNSDRGTPGTMAGSDRRHP